MSSMMGIGPILVLARLTHGHKKQCLMPDFEILRLAEDFKILRLTPDFEILRLTYDFKTLRLIIRSFCLTRRSLILCYCGKTFHPSVKCPWQNGMSGANVPLQK